MDSEQSRRALVRLRTTEITLVKTRGTMPAAGDCGGKVVLAYAFQTGKVAEREGVRQRLWEA